MKTEPLGVQHRNTLALPIVILPKYGSLIACEGPVSYQQFHRLCARAFPSEVFPVAGAGQDGALSKLHQRPPNHQPAY